MIRKAMVLSVVMYGCESWTVKKAEGQRIDAGEGVEKREPSYTVGANAN